MFQQFKPFNLPASSQRRRGGCDPDSGLAGGFRRHSRSKDDGAGKKRK